MRMSEEAKRLRSPIVTVLGHVDHGKCLHPSEKILLANGKAAEISSLARGLSPSQRVGDYEVFTKRVPVLSLSLDGYLSSAFTESIWRIKYKGPLYKILLSDGRFVRVTPEHPFLTRDGWVRADKIEKHDMIAVPDLADDVVDSLNSGDRVNKRVIPRSREISFKEVKSVEVEDYEGFLYDLSVPETQSFIANGIVVHNTTLLDKIRGTAVVSKEPGEMTQHVGASLVPASVIEKIITPLKNMFSIKLTIPGLLFIDTPGHEAFSNLRRRGGSVADFAILVIDVMEGVKKQTLESIEILLSRKVPFVIAANKIDRIPGWRSLQDTPFTLSAKSQSKQALEELDKRIYALVGQLSQANIPSERYDKIRDFRKTIAIVPISAKSGEGLAELLAVLAGIIQRFLTHKIMFTWGPAEGVVLEVKEIPGLGHCADVIIYDGILRKGDLIVLGGYEGPITTRVRALLMPRLLEEMRVAGEASFHSVEEVVAAAGVRLSAPEIEKVVAGAPLRAVENEEKIEEVSRKIAEELMQVRFSKNIVGVVVKADTLGTLEAVVSMLEKRGISVRLADVGPLTRREVVEASIVARENKYLGVILLFNVKVPPDIEELALREGVKIFRDNIIYKLIESYENWVSEEKSKEVLEKALRTVFPAKLQVLPGYVFRRSNPAIVGVRVLGGVIRPGYGLMRYDGKPLGRINQIQLKGKPLQEARSGSEVAISVEGNVLVGRHFNEGDILYTDPAEKDLETFINDFKNELNSETIQIVKEIIEIKQKEDRKFCLGILVKLRSYA